MTLKETIKADEAHFLNTDEFADVADFSGTLINGILDRGMEGGFTCRDDELSDITHGAPVIIDGITYWLEGYQPDGFGMANLVLRKDR